MTIKLHFITLFVFCLATPQLHAASTALSLATTASAQGNAETAGVFSLANTKQARGKILDILNQLREAATATNQKEQQKQILKSVNKKIKKLKQDTAHSTASIVEPVSVTAEATPTSNIATARLSQASTADTVTTLQTPATEFAITYDQIQSICQELRTASDQTAQAHIIDRIDALQAKLSATVCTASSSSSSASVSSSPACEEETPVITIIPDDAPESPNTQSIGALTSTQGHARKTSQLWGDNASAEAQAINAEVMGAEAAANSSASAQSTSDAASVSLSVVSDQAATPEAARGQLVSASDATTSSSSSAAMTVTPTQSMELDDVESDAPTYLHSIPQSSPPVLQQDDIPVTFSNADEDLIDKLIRTLQAQHLSVSKIIRRTTNALIDKQFQLNRTKSRAFRLATERYERIFKKTKATESITELLNKFERHDPLQRISIEAEQAQIIQTDLQFAEDFYRDHKDEIEGTFEIARELPHQQSECAYMSDLMAEALFSTYRPNPNAELAQRDVTYAALNLPALKKVIKAKYDKQHGPYTMSLSAAPDRELLRSGDSSASNKHPLLGNQMPPKRLSRWERFKRTTLGRFLTDPWTKGIGGFCIIGGILVGVYYTVNHYCPNCTI